MTQHEILKKPAKTAQSSPAGELKPQKNRFGKKKNSKTGVILLILLLAAAIVCAAVFSAPLLAEIFGADAHIQEESTEAEEIALNTEADIDTEEPAADKADEVPFGEGPADAVYIKVGKTYIFTGDEDKSSWERWCHFKTSADLSTYYVEIDANVGQPLAFDIYDKKNKLVGRGGYSTEKVSIPFELESSSEYYIKLSANNRSAVYNFIINEEPCDAGRDMDSAVLINFGEPYTKKLETTNTVDWFKFRTTENYSVYRFNVNRKVSGNVPEAISFRICDEKGIKLEEINLSYSLFEKTFEVELEGGKEHYIMVLTDRFNTGDYSFWVEEVICDAGRSEEEAFLLKAGEEYKGVLDTSFDEWFVYELEEGTYNLSLSNTNVLESINIHASCGDNRLLSNLVWPGESTLKMFNAKQGDKLYVRVFASTDNSDAEYILTVE